MVFEDDLVLAPGAVRFIDEGLERYEREPRAFSVSAYRYGRDGKPGFGRRFCSWSWATWRDRWQSVDWAVSDYSSFVKNPFARHAFNRGGDDLCDMLDTQMDGLIDSWAIRMNYAQFKAGGLTLFPARSLIENRGFDGSGTHIGTQQQTADLGRSADSVIE